MKKELRSGYTTGACAAAAARGAAEMLAGQKTVDLVTLALPGGTLASFSLQGQEFTDESAACYVVKDAGDDPDITNGVEVHASIKSSPRRNGHDEYISIAGGVGIGKVTKPGLAVPPGEWAINPVPRMMINLAVESVLKRSMIRHLKYVITVSIPDGEERARKTLNGRLGIIGGLSILGTTGIVSPVSAKAWTDTIDAALDVARACNCKTVVLSTGRSSEMAAQRYLPGLCEESYVMMGDHLAHALRSCAARGFMHPVVACQFAKLLKIACGHENTHAATSDLDLGALLIWAETAHAPPELLAAVIRANTAREIAVNTDFDPWLMNLVISKVKRSAERHSPGISVTPLLCKYDGTIAI